MPKVLDQEQAIILTGFTGIMCCASFADFHGDVENRIGRPVWTHEFASKEFSEKVKELYREDFMAMLGGRAEPHTEANDD